MDGKFGNILATRLNPWKSRTLGDPFSIGLGHPVSDVLGSISKVAPFADLATSALGSIGSIIKASQPQESYLGESGESKASKDRQRTTNIAVSSASALVQTALKCVGFFI